MNSRELIIAVLTEHVMTQSAVNGRGGIRQWRRHCASCGHDLPWTDWDAELRAHQADVLVERLGL